MNTLVLYFVIAVIVCFILFAPGIGMIMLAGGVGGWQLGRKLEPSNNNLSQLLGFSGFFMPLIPLVLWIGVLCAGSKV